jgi:hypothetical protein
MDMMHGDHIEPLINGGLTALLNLQALCGSRNLRKRSQPQAVIQRFFDVAKCAAATVPLRRWQLDVKVERKQMDQFAGVYSFGGAWQARRRLRLRVPHAASGRRFHVPEAYGLGGALGVVPPECDGCVVSPEFPVFEVNRDLIVPEVLDVYFRSPSVWPRLAEAISGTNAQRRWLCIPKRSSTSRCLSPQANPGLVRDARRALVDAGRTQAAIAQHL